MRVEELVAREEIRDVVKRLARGTDRLDEQLMASCYHEDGFDDHNAFRGSGTEFAKWVPQALSGFDETMHFVGDPLIELRGETAQVNTYCVAHHLTNPAEGRPGTDMVIGLRYLDRFECRAGVWKIARRVCAFDWTTTTTFERPLRHFFAEDYTVGSRDRSDPTYTGV